MSLVGNELFNKLFGSETGQRLVSMLSEEFARPGTIVQVWTDTDALQFILPWAWTLAGKRQQTDIQQFWGYRYVLEQLRQG